MSGRKAAPSAVGAIHVALLRGVNVGGHTLPMKALAELFTDVGCNDVRTYIQSGNVVFRADAELRRRIPGLIAAEIEARFGFATPVVLRTAAELGAVTRGNPYLAGGADPKALHVMFLADAPKPAAVKLLEPRRSPPDTFELRGREVYLHCPNGLARTKLTNDYFDRRLSTVSTVRNWRTVLKLLEMAEG